MSIVGFDGLPNVAHFATPITVVKQPVTEMAVLSMNLLMEQINSNEPVEPMTVKLPTTLLRRGSVGILRGDHSGEGGAHRSRKSSVAPA